MRIRKGQSQRGDATVEVVLAVPVLMLLIMLVIQFGLWYHASHAASAAAQEGVRAARVYDGSASDGQRRAESFMATAAPTLVEDVQVTAARDLATARVEVRGTLHSVIPGFNVVVHAEAESPIERFRPDAP